MVPPTWIISIGIRVGRSRVEIIDIINLVASVWGKRTPNLQFSAKWSIEPHI